MAGTITEDTNVPVGAIKWLIGSVLAGVIAIGGLVVSFRVDIALLKRDTGAIVDRLDTIAKNVDGIGELRGKVEVHEVRIDSIEKDLERLKVGK